MIYQHLTLIKPLFDVIEAFATFIFRLLILHNRKMETVFAFHLQNHKLNVCVGGREKSFLELYPSNYAVSGNEIYLRTVSNLHKFFIKFRSRHGNRNEQL